MEYMFNQLTEARVFFVKGYRVKKSGWFSVWDALEQFIPYWSAFALVLVWICLKFGIIKTIEETPL